MNPSVCAKYLYRSWFVLFLLGIHLVTLAQYSVIPLTAASYNNDVIAESGNNPSAVTTTGFDQPAGGYLFYSVAFQAANSALLTFGGLPNNGKVIFGTDTFQLASYSSNNCLYFPNQSTVSSTQSMYLTTPAQYGEVALLATCGYGATSGYVNASVNVTLHFTDNSSTSYGNISVVDWFGGTPYVINGLGRITRSSTVTGQGADASNPRLYSYNIVLSATDRVKNLNRIDLVYNTTNNRTTVGFFALSGVSTSLYVTLPLNLNSLTGQYQGSDNSVFLQWSASNTSNTSVFQVQRSVNGTDFTTIAAIQPQIDAGNSIYSYVDPTVNKYQGSYFYRIEEILSNGAVDYSQVLLINTLSSSSYTITQLGGILYGRANQSAQTVQYAIVSASGQIYKRGILASGSNFAIDVHSLSTGIYFLHVTSGKQHETFPFLK